MDYNEFLTKVIDEGIEAAKADYTKESDVQNLEGSIAGFNACRDKTPEELIDVWNEASKKMNEAFGEQKDNYWWFRCHQLEVEWVCNVISAMLMNQGNYTPLLSWLPTANGVNKAASIIDTSQIN